MRKLANKQTKNFSSKLLASEGKNLKNNTILENKNSKLSNLSISKSFRFLEKNKSKNFNLLEFLLKDSDRVLIISLIILLMDDEKNFTLMLALLYILI